MRSDIIVSSAHFLFSNFVSIMKMKKNRELDGEIRPTHFGQ